VVSPQKRLAAKKQKDTKDFLRLLRFFAAIIPAVARQNPKSEIRNPKLYRLVPLFLDWFSAHARDLPWRRTRDPYAIWVSEIMLQQTQVKTVIPFWNRWMRELPTIESAANASSEKIHKLWEGLGYYTRARNLQKAAKIILEKHGGKFPRNFEEVLALPGIGRYTAGAICSIAFNQPTPILDGNVIRVLTRIFGIAENPKEKKTSQLLWQIAQELVTYAKAQNSQRNTCSYLNQSLMELGALICTPRNPRCKFCPIKKLCVAFKENRIEELPNLGKREAATARRFIAFVVERKGKILVRQRPAGIVNAHLWEFPNYEINGSKQSAKAIFNSTFDFRPNEFQPLCTIKHSITRYRITLEAFHVRLENLPVKSAGVWLSSKKFDSLAFTAAHKKLASFATSCILSGR
jgi:A/G-specific adenine glycosylase